jgi:DNA primase
MTLQQALPGLQSQPGGAIVAIADSLFDIFGPAQELTAELTREKSNQPINQIRAIDPDYKLGSLGFPQTLQGQVNQLNKLRLDRAAAFLRIRNEARPLQVEMLRFAQKSVDQAYAEGLKLLRAGKLNIRLSEQEALGFVDKA